LWDSFGLGLDFEDDEYDHGSEIAIWDLHKDLKISSGRRCAVVGAAESVVLTAETSRSRHGFGFGGYDKSPAVYAAWRPQSRATWVDEKEE
nr:UV excision repair protein [Tanacetum cinerariifolium]